MIMVKRYKHHDVCPEIEQGDCNEDTEFVQACDYEALAAELADWKRMRNEMRDVAFANKARVAYLEGALRVIAEGTICPDLFPNDTDENAAAMKIGQTNGCFDMFHDGHHHYLARCKEGCDYLIVAINSDASVQRLKGVARPRQEWRIRVENVMETGLVDAVIPFEGRWDRLAHEIRPAVIFQGEEYRRELGEVLAMRKIRWKEEPGFAFDVVPIIYIERLPNFSTSLQIDALTAKTNA
jgi:cytidyltransferase-like protein